MTFKDKLRKDHPEYIHPGYLGGCKGCPVDYGYEDTKPCKTDIRYAGDCGRRCWDREIPKTTPENEKV